MAHATDKELGDLHGAVATTLARIVSEGVEVPTEEGTKTVTAPASYLAVAVAFLKNNNVTAAQDNERISDLKSKLAERRAKAKGSITKAALEDAAASLERDLGGFGGFVQ
jgi:hypothetical protein